MLSFVFVPVLKQWLSISLHTLQSLGHETFLSPSAKLSNTVVSVSSGNCGAEEGKQLYRQHQGVFSLGAARHSCSWCSCPLSLHFCFFSTGANSNAAPNDTRNETQTRSSPAGSKAKLGTSVMRSYGRVRKSPTQPLGMCRRSSSPGTLRIQTRPGFFHPWA